VNIMVHCFPGGEVVASPPTLPRVCPNCGSHRTEVLGPLSHGKAIALRCNSCGARSEVARDEHRSSAPNDMAAELAAIAAIADALAQLPSADGRRRVLHWAAEQFTAIDIAGSTRESLTPPPQDQTLLVDNLEDFFLPPRLTTEPTAASAHASSMDGTVEPRVSPTPTMRTSDSSLLVDNLMEFFAPERDSTPSIAAFPEPPDDLFEWTAQAESFGEACEAEPPSPPDDLQPRYDVQVAQDMESQDPAAPAAEEPALDTLVADFVSDFRRLATAIG
jgi:hypothetical protein